MRTVYFGEPRVKLAPQHNKRFKADSQRVAFVVCGKFSDLGGVRKHRIALLTT